MSVSFIPSRPWRYLLPDQSFADDSSFEDQSKNGSKGKGDDAPASGNDQTRHDDEWCESRRQRNQSKLLICVQYSAPNGIDTGNDYNRRQQIEESPRLQKFFRAKAGGQPGQVIRSGDDYADGCGGKQKRAPRQYIRKKSLSGIGAFLFSDLNVGWNKRCVE